MQITTPSGYIVEIADRVSFGVRKAIKRAMFRSTKVNSSQAESKEVEMNLDSTIDATETAMKLLVQKITMGDQVITDPEKILASIDDMDYADGAAIEDQINKLTQGNTPPNSPS